MTDDPYSWLEDVDGETSLDWVRERNGEKAAELAATPSFAATKQRIRSILDSDEKIPDVTRRGDHLYNFWKDADHERGLWRRTTLESYRTESPEWETVLDLDALNEAEGENWVWHGATVWRGAGTDDAFRYALVSLSRGGADADVTREFDLHTKTFVEGGFHRPESKGGVAWETLDSVIVFTDFGEGSMTPSGYPRIVKRWHRGTALEDAVTLLEGDPEDMYIGGGSDQTPGYERTFVFRRRTFRTGEMYIVEGEQLLEIPTPPSAEEDVHREWLTVELREDWTPADVTYPAGALLAAKLEHVLAGSTEFHVLYAPTDTTSLAGASWTRDHLVLNILDDVTNRLEVLTPGAGGFARTAVDGVPSVGTVAVAPVDPVAGNDVWLYITDFLTPTTLSLATIGADGEMSEPEPLKAMPTFFDATGLVAEQHFVTSDDGTRVPYFLVRREDLAFDGTAPTLLYGYGGFEISLTPTYSGGLGSAWLEQGGVYALANIRGGGEYGPAWHQAALKANRHKAYEDMAAVARDLVARGITSHKHLGVQGGSNGGLLTGNMITRYPELFGAVVIQVPLLDMKRYSHLLAGASWMDEYGDPDDPAQWEFIRTFSPYHLFDADREYPPVLFTTSTRDDRVHPGHARKMAAAMLASGKDVTYYENIEGGHGGAATNDQASHMSSLAYEFLRSRLG
ncbi:prolyl oligopeptidase family serine peptidase [Pseudactinotalea sp.]|uniref:prolyl oligopeptidase family serine peptidase n=1 Tax=Pseudactinotalea sp. TaxID=1926260 RepID=UPI003B3A1443